MSASRPFPQSYWVREGLLCAGAYPGSPTSSVHADKCLGVVAAGVRRVISLMEDHEKNHDGLEFTPYAPLMLQFAAERAATIEFMALPIRDAHAPTRGQMAAILAALANAEAAGIPTFVHCWGGHGRTSTVVACYLIERGLSADAAIERVLELRRPLPKHHYPFETDQEAFVRAWVPK